MSESKFLRMESLLELVKVGTTSSLFFFFKGRLMVLFVFLISAVFDIFLSAYGY